LVPWSQEHAIPLATTDLRHREVCRPLRWWNSVRRLRSILKEHQIDVVHCNQIYSYPTAGAAGRDLDVVRICHMRNELTPNDVRWWCADGADGIVCISHHIEKQVAATWPAKHTRPEIRTILNPVLLPVLGNRAKHLCG